MCNYNDGSALGDWRGLTGAGKRSEHRRERMAAAKQMQAAIEGGVDKKYAAVMVKSDSEHRRVRVGRGADVQARRLPLVPN